MAFAGNGKLIQRELRAVPHATLASTPGKTTVEIVDDSL